MEELKIEVPAGKYKDMSGKTEVPTVKIDSGDSPVTIVISEPMKIINIGKGIVTIQVDRIKLP